MRSPRPCGSASTSTCAADSKHGVGRRATVAATLAPSRSRLAGPPTTQHLLRVGSSLPRPAESTPPWPGCYPLEFPGGPFEFLVSPGLSPRSSSRRSRLRCRSISPSRETGRRSRAPPPASKLCLDVIMLLALPSIRSPRTRRPAAVLAALVLAFVGLVAVPALPAQAA